MKLPKGIEKEIIEYLHLEFGQSADDPDALKVSDLKYEGRHIIKGVPTHFWSYPAGAGRHWATVEERGESYNLSMSTVGPHGEVVDRAKALRKLRVEFRGLSEEAKPMQPIRKDVKGGSANIPVRFPSGEEMEIDVEVHDPDSDPDISIAVTHKDGRTLYIRCTSGVVVSYETEYGYDCLISVGTGPWEGN